MTEPRFTPTWMTMSQAARGWGVSRRQAYNIVRQEEDRLKRKISHHGKIRTADFLAVPRGDVAASPMIPDVAILWAKFDALEGLVDRLINRVAVLSRTQNGGR